MAYYDLEMERMMAEEDHRNEINALKAENAQLRETIERLHQYIERLDGVKEPAHKPLSDMELFELEEGS